MCIIIAREENKRYQKKKFKVNLSFPSKIKHFYPKKQTLINPSNKREKTKRVANITQACDFPQNRHADFKTSGPLNIQLTAKKNLRKKSIYNVYTRKQQNK